MANLPIYLNSEVGYALWWLTHPETGPTSGPEIIERLLARGNVGNREQARAVLAQARSNIAAQGRISGASQGQSLRAACGYKCPPDTPIALRIMVNVVDGHGNIVGERSVVVQGYASENLGAVLHRARGIFNRRFRSGTGHRSGQLIMTSDPTPADVIQVLLNYTEGST